MTKGYILNFLKTNKQLLNEKYSVTKIGLFGSYTKNFNLSTAIEQELPKQANSDIIEYLKKLKKDNSAG